ncbi:HPr family phosphocarrier protein [uncultured Tessaracoccus sp.]|uniref:HPr family phosphocarrier protein n=1 Tax=uncultured Tessaracoccus sp. TaxID=905023 RepID=UPI0025D96BEF|nr:HPr family phosphocarrier protein [uncultured Tessaracoccus sp.]
MIERTATVAATSGLHARPAAVFVDAVEQSGLDVTITFDGEEADAGSLLDVITLGVELGDEVTLATESDDEAALDQLVALLERKDA